MTKITESGEKFAIELFEKQGANISTPLSLLGC